MFGFARFLRFTSLLTILWMNRHAGESNSEDSGASEAMGAAERPRHKRHVPRRRSWRNANGIQSGKDF